MTKQLVRVLRRSIADIPEDALRVILGQCREAIDSVLTPAVVVESAEVIEMPTIPAELEMSYGDVSESLAQGE
jgi:hypothetical protein